MNRTVAILAAAAFTGGVLVTANPASAYCIEIEGVGCVNPCMTVYRAFYDATGKPLPGACPA